MEMKPVGVARALREILRQTVALDRQEQRIVEIKGDVAGEGHVPSLPVFGDAGGLVGGVEVEGEADGEDAGEAERHVAVAGEVEVELHGIDNEAGPRGSGVEGAGMGEGDVSGVSEVVGDEDLLGEAEEEPGRSEGDIGGLEGEATAGWDGR
jgi:hypothetical protein